MTVRMFTVTLLASKTSIKEGFPGGIAAHSPPTNTADTSWVLGPERFHMPGSN